MNFVDPPAAVQQAETLKGNRKCLPGTRLDGQWRICFAWTTVGASGVEIVDYPWLRCTVKKRSNTHPEKSC